MILRPTLAAHVAVRRHVVNGEAFVVVHDTQTGQVAKIGEREWGLIRGADGTRDLEGVRVAAAARGWSAKGGHVEAFFSDLYRAGMLSDGVGPAPEPPRRPVSALPLVPLPGFRLRCDGSGSCCRLYPTTSFSPLEVSHAQVHASEVLDCGLDPEGVFTPENGSTNPPWRAQTVAMVDGRCAFLSPSQRCRLHEAGGVGAKPLGCQHFPTTFVDDGVSIRVGVAPECACVFRSALDPTDGGAALIPGAASTASDLHPSIYVSDLAEHVPVTADTSVPRAIIVALGDALYRRLEDPSLDCDAARLLWFLATVLERHHDWSALDARDAANEAVAGATGDPASAMAHGLAPALAALSDALDRRIAQDGDWRAESDLALRVPRWMRAALPAVTRKEWLVEVDQPMAERFYLRAILHGHLWLIADDGPLGDSLRRRAIRILIARGLARVSAVAEHTAEPALSYPLALVEAVSRSLQTGSGSLVR